MKKNMDYKIDPAPSWGGDMEYIRSLQLWLVEAEACLPHSRITKLSSLLAHLTVDDICADNGHKVILGIAARGGLR